MKPVPARATLREFVIYDALYAWLQRAKGERHTWNPQRVPAPA